MGLGPILAVITGHSRPCMGCALRGGRYKICIPAQRRYGVLRRSLVTLLRMKLRSAGIPPCEGRKNRPKNRPFDEKHGPLRWIKPFTLDKTVPKPYPRRASRWWSAAEPRNRHHDRRCTRRHRNRNGSSATKSHDFSYVSAVTFGDSRPGIRPHRQSVPAPKRNPNDPQSELVRRTSDT